MTDKIKRFCYDEGITVNISNYKDEIDKEKEDSSIVDDTVFIAAIMITVLAVVSIAASNIVYCLMRRKHYGIMLANGMCKADIIWLIAMQNAIVMVLAAVAAWIVRLRAEFETLFPKKVLEETGRLYEGGICGTYALYAGNSDNISNDTSCDIMCDTCGNDWQDFTGGYGFGKE